MFWNIFLNSLVLIVGILVIGWGIDALVRNLTKDKSDNT